MNHFQAGFAIALVVIAVVAAIWWRHTRSRALLTAWAERNGYRILRQEYRLFRRGPFFFTTAKGHVVYYVTVQDQPGLVRRGWVRCGSWWLGLVSDKVQVRWDD